VNNLELSLGHTYLAILYKGDQSLNQWSEISYIPCLINSFISWGVLLELDGAVIILIHTQFQDLW
jgi:hypothetical protein